MIITLLTNMEIAILFHNNDTNVNTCKQLDFIKFKDDNASMTSDNDLFIPATQVSKTGWYQV